MAFPRTKRTLIAAARQTAKAMVGLLALTLITAPTSSSAAVSGLSPAAADPNAGLRLTSWTYGSAANARQTATVFQDPAAKGRRPLVVLIHGGAWSIGSQASMADEARIWARDGWVAVTMNYRLKTKGSNMISDVRTVVEHFRDAAYVDPKKVVLYGSSAGGHLATLVGAQMGSPSIAGVVAWSPVVSPYNQWQTGNSASASPEDKALGEKAKKFFGYDWVRTSALSYAKRKNVPKMFLAGSKDDHVHWSPQGGILCKTLTVKKCTRSWIPGDQHGMGLPNTQPALAQSARDWASAVTSG